MTTSLPLPQPLQGLRLPVIAAPMLTVSYPRLVSALCRAGVVGSFPALNARPAPVLGEWLTALKQDLAAAAAVPGARKPAAFAVNLIVNQSNPRLEQDMRTCIEHRVPIYITSLQAPPKELIDAAHACGGIVLHDVVNLRHAEKALKAGVDGLIVVAAGAGGHAGTLSPFALVNEVRRIFSGPVALSGAMATGADVLSAQAMGADLAYIGTRFIATQESEAVQAYKDTLMQASAGDICYTDYFTGVHGNYLRQSIEAAGLVPAQLKKSDDGRGYFGPASAQERPKNWKDSWGAGQGVGSMHDIPSIAELMDRMEAEYRAATQRLPALWSAYCG